MDIMYIANCNSLNTLICGNNLPLYNLQTPILDFQQNNKSH